MCDIIIFVKSYHGTNGSMAEGERNERKYSTKL